MIPRLFLIFALLSISTDVDAANLHPIFFLGGEAGGEKTSTFGGKVKDPIAAGAGYSLGLGIALSVSPTTPHGFETRLTLGLNSWSVGDDNGLTSWTSIPIELQHFYINTRNAFKVGYGFSYRTATSLETEGGGFDQDVRFDSNLGYIFAIEKYFPKGGFASSLGIRYTFIRYTEATTGTSFRGDSLGVYIQMLGSHTSAE